MPPKIKVATASKSVGAANPRTLAPRHSTAPNTPEARTVIRSNKEETPMETDVPKATSEAVVDLHPRELETLEEAEVQAKPVWPETADTTEEALMHLRKKYKRSESLLMRTDSHLYFVNQYIAKRKSPRRAYKLESSAKL